MEAYLYKSGPAGKDGNWSQHYAVREAKDEFEVTKAWMANPPLGSKRRPMYPVEENFEGKLIRRWVEYGSEKA